VASRQELLAVANLPRSPYIPGELVPLQERVAFVVFKGEDMQPIWLTRGLSPLLIASAFVATTVTVVAMCMPAKADDQRAGPTRPIRELEDLAAYQEKTLGAMHPDLAETLHSLGVAHHQQGDADTAGGFLEKALAIRSKRREPADVLIAETLQALLKVRATQGRWEACELLFTSLEALHNRMFGADDLLSIGTLISLAGTQSLLRHYDDAEKSYLEALGRLAKTVGDDHVITAKALQGLGHNYFQCGKYSQAEKPFRKALAVREKLLGSEDQELSESMDSLGQCLASLGKDAEAEQLYKKLLRLAETSSGAGSPQTADAMQSLASLYAAQGKWADAESLAKQSLEISERAVGDKGRGTGNSLMSLGLLYTKQKKFSHAEPLFRRALGIYEQVLGPEHPDTAIASTALALMHWNAGNHVEADRLYRRNLKYLENTFGPDHPVTAQLLNNLAGNLHFLGDYSQAAELAERAVKIHVQSLGKSHPTTSVSLVNLSVIMAAQGQWLECAELRERGQRALQSHFYDSLTALLPDEQIAFLLGDYAIAHHSALSVGFLQAASPRIRKLSAGWLANGKAVGHAASMQQAMLTRYSAPPRTASLVAELRKVRAEIAGVAQKTIFTGDSEAYHEKVIALKANEQSIVRELGGQILSLQRSIAWLDIETVREQLPPRSILIDIARFEVFDFRAKGKGNEWKPARYVAWIVPPQGYGEITVADLGDAEVIEQAVLAYREAMTAAGSEKDPIRNAGEPVAEKKLMDCARPLAELVIEPILNAINAADANANFQELVISPDADLWLVPWCALPLKDGRYAIEQYAIRTVISARDLLPSEPDKAEAARSVVFANPDFDLSGIAAAEATTAVIDESHDSLQTEEADGKADAAATTFVSRSTTSIEKAHALPGTADEAKLVAPAIVTLTGHKPIVYDGAKALEAVAKRVMRPRVLVFATHGFVLPGQSLTKQDADLAKINVRGMTNTKVVLSSAGERIENPLVRCGLLLSGCNTPPEELPDGIDDGRLTGLEILGMDLYGTELVVLSACDTGLGKVQYGEGVAGLRQAFMLAGAESVVASLWQVTDAETADLISGFFSNLAAKMPRPEALRQAQLEIIAERRREKGAAHPFYWAAFGITGR
jgi:CHAT domain-containing protein/tetratricopeptide (TPR) repeat protein